MLYVCTFLLFLVLVAIGLVLRPLRWRVMHRCYDVERATEALPVVLPALMLAAAILVAIALLWR